MRDRLLGHGWLVLLVVGWGIAVAALPQLAEGAPLPPTTEGTPDADLERVRAMLERKIIRDRLDALGVSPAEATVILARLSPDERSELAARARELDAGGEVAILSIAIIVGLLTIMVLELLGRRVVSRP